jgi:probable rRNA maturation factor
MPIQFVSSDIPFTLPNKEAVVRLVKKVIANEKHSAGTINFTFCSDAFLFDINKKFLNHSTLTDIITFQYPAKKLSGELFISVDRVKDNAKKFNSTAKQELHRVIIHGILHLCGYGDKKTSERRIMKEKEEYYLNMAAVK